MKELAELIARVAELERRVSGAFRHGTVAEVDTSKQRIRMKLGDSDAGGDFLSPWIPYSQDAGAWKFHHPPSVGQQMTMLSPTGDWRQSVALPFIWSDDNPSPGDQEDDHILTFGSITMSVKPDQITLQLGATTITIKDGEVTVDANSKILFKSDLVQNEGDELKHNAKNVGDDHKHEDVMPGGGITGVPV